MMKELGFIKEITSTGRTTTIIIIIVAITTKENDIDRKII
jgi:hypothetical protein